MRRVVLYGYVYAVVAVRGSGASYGTRVDPTPPKESLDAYDITEWLAEQPWCSGKVGMYGISYSGTDQFMAASAAPPHLKDSFSEKGTIFQIGVAPCRVDIITQISGVEFEQAYPKRKEIEIDGLKSPVISKEALIRNKESTGREKDKLDSKFIRE